MTVIVLGAAGMLGHMTYLYLKEKYSGQVIASARNKTGIVLIDQNLFELDLNRFDNLSSFLSQHRPCVVINCAAINNPYAPAEELEKINSALPRAIADILDGFNDGSRLIHISTDGVFRGDRGGYRENDAADAQDPYGVSKRAGEVLRAPHLTIRTSIIGPDPLKQCGLMNWFLSQSGEVKGFSRVLWNGVTTLELARFINDVIGRNISGLCHLGGQIVSKHDLLISLKEVFGSGSAIVVDNNQILNRTLSSKREDVVFQTLSVMDMLRELKGWMVKYSPIYQGFSFLK